MVRRGWSARIVAGALLVACTQDPPEPPGPDDTVDDTEAPVDTVPTDVRRPLCQVDASPPPIAADLVAWADGVIAGENNFYGHAHFEELEPLDDAHLGDTPDAVVQTRLDRGWRRLAIGRFEDAIRDFEAGLALATTDAPRWRGRARQLVAVGLMRKAEVDNCATNPAAGACIAPFDADALHAQPEGTLRAIELLTQFLTEDEPDHLTARWLLNVAHMAVGSWPDGVPPALLVPPELLASEAPAAPWTNVAPAIGPSRLDLLGGSAVEDFDGDGLLDLLTSSMGMREGMTLLLNQGDGRFCDASDASGVSAIPAVLDVFPADYDNDGDVDVMAPRGAWLGPDGHVRPSLLRNDGSGVFTDVAAEAGLTDEPGPAQVAAWGDVDNDGLLDLFVGRERAKGEVRQPPSTLYHNAGDGVFVPVPDAGIPAMGWVKGTAFGDLNNDGLPDLYVSAMQGKDFALINNGDLSFRDATMELGLAGDNNTFAVVIYDHNQDGRLDLFSAGYNSFDGMPSIDPAYGHTADDFMATLLGLPTPSTSSALYLNDGDSFHRVTGAPGLERTHAVMGCSTLDLDADGWPDLYIGTGAPSFEALLQNVALRNDRAGGVQDITWDAHLGHLQKGHAVGAGDLDEDGDEDLLVEIGGIYEGDAFRDAVFQNPVASANAVTLRLEGVTSNRFAVGARVRVITPVRTQHYLVGTGGSFGANSLQLEVALGEASSVEAVEIDWPGGQTEVVDGVPLGSVVTIREGEGVVASRPYQRIALAQPEHAHDP